MQLLLEQDKSKIRTKNRTKKGNIKSKNINSVNSKKSKKMS